MFTEEQVRDAFFARSTENDVLQRTGLRGTRRVLTAEELMTILLNYVGVVSDPEFVDPLTGQRPADSTQHQRATYEQLHQRYRQGRSILDNAELVTTEQYTTNSHGDALCKAAGPVDSPWVQIPLGHVATTQAYCCIALKRKERT